MKIKIGRFSLPLAALCASAFLAGSVAAPHTAFASAKGKKNTTIVLGALAAHQLLTGKTTNGILLGAGTAYAYKKYNDARKRDNDRRRYSEYNGYNDRRSRSRYDGGNRDSRSRDRSYRDRDRSYRDSSYDRSTRSTSTGWGRGRKTGWNGGDMPPGQARKHDGGGHGHGHHHDDD